MQLSTVATAKVRCKTHHAQESMHSIPSIFLFGCCPKPSHKINRKLRSRFDKLKVEVRYYLEPSTLVPCHGYLTRLNKAQGTTAKSL